MVQNCPTQSAPHASTLCEYMWDDFRLCLAGVTGFGFGLRLDFHSLKYKHFYRRRFFCCSFHICAVCFVYIFIVCNMAVERKSFMCYCTRQLFHKCGDAVKWLPPIQIWWWTLLRTQYSEWIFRFNHCPFGVLFCRNINPCIITLRAHNFVGFSWLFMIGHQTAILWRWLFFGQRYKFAHFFLFICWFGKQFELMAFVGINCSIDWMKQHRH